jgi:hypothetical protein
VTLTDPREALANQSNFIGYLMGLASLGQVVHTLAGEGISRTDTSGDVDDFVHVLLGIASLAESVERLVETSSTVQLQPAASPAASVRWLR